MITRLFRFIYHLIRNRKLRPSVIERLSQREPLTLSTALKAGDQLCVRVLDNDGTLGESFTLEFISSSWVNVGSLKIRATQESPLPPRNGGAFFPNHLAHTPNLNEIERAIHAEARTLKLDLNYRELNSLAFGIYFELFKK